MRPSSPLVLLLCLAVAAPPAVGLAEGGAVRSSLAAPPPSAASAASAAGNASTADNASANVTLVSAVPNPVAHGDAGEYVVLNASGQWRLSRYAIADDHDTVALPNRTVGGRVVVTGNRSALPSAVEGTVVEIGGWPRLANGGDRVALLAGTRTLDAMRYESAPEAERVVPTEGGVVWRPLGATDRDPVAGAGGTVEAFVLPDSPGIPIEVLRGADDRVVLAAYTLTSRRVADALVAARERGVNVSVLVDGGPVGGLSERSAAVLDRLTAAGVAVSVLEGPRSAYRFQHAKYAVADDRAVVLTENWKPAGTGGHASRGWGVAVESPAVVRGLRETFRADTAAVNAVPWAAYRRNASFENATPSMATYGTRFEATEVRAERAELLLAPDNAAGRLERLIDNATESIRVLQVGVGDRDNRLLRAAVDAARRGVEVEILLSSAWYVEADNRALAANLTALAGREGIPLSVRLADPNGRFGKVHAKGVLVDGEAVAVGSLNWNDNAFENNREVVVLLHGEAVAGYYERVFRADWRGGIQRLPVELIAALAVLAVLAALVGRRISFENDDRAPDRLDWDC